MLFRSDLSDSGMRFYGKLPATLAAGDKITGHLVLPKGPVPFWGEVRERVAMPANPRVTTAIGCQFSTGDEGRQQLEEFLFGSDLQWVLNGYTDRVHTPMSRWLSDLVEGPVHNPVADVRWNSAELRVERDGPAEPVLLSSNSIASADVFVVSPNALPEHRDLILDVYRRTDASSRRVQLERFALPGASASAAGVSVYRLVDAGTDTAPSLPAPVRTAENVAAAERSRGFEALPSTY